MKLLNWFFKKKIIIAVSYTVFVFVLILNVKFFSFKSTKENKIYQKKTPFFIKMRLAQAPFLIFLLTVSVVSSLQDQSRFLTKTLEKNDIENYILNQEKNIMLSTERRFKAQSNSELRMQKISLYNFKNTQVNIEFIIIFSLKLCISSILELFLWEIKKILSM